MTKITLQAWIHKEKYKYKLKTRNRLLINTNLKAAQILILTNNKLCKTILHFE